MLMRLSSAVTMAWTVCVVCLRKYFLPGLQRPRVHPADARVQIRAAARQIFQPHNHVAAADVNIVLKAEA